nr:unnamed protein product [Spirometra erinaceieuropaei]
MMAWVTVNRTVSEAFVVTDGVKQGCFLAPALSSLLFTAMLMDAYRDGRRGFRIAHRSDSQLLNHRRMHFQSGVFTLAVYELCFADDCTLKATSEGDVQRSMDILVVAACDNSGQVINTEKTVVMQEPPPDAVYVAHQGNVIGAQRLVVDSCTYLDWTLCHNTKIDDKVVHRISKASRVFGRLEITVCNRHGLHQTEDVQSGLPVDAAVRSRDLDGIQESGAETQSLPPQLFSTDTEAEVAGPDPSHGGTRADGNPQHLRRSYTHKCSFWESLCHFLDISLNSVLLRGPLIPPYKML